LFGSGANGKGSFMRLLEMLVGDENTHSTTLETICENKHEIANIYNKRLVTCPDEDRRIRGFSVFKSLTGSDTVRAEEKFQKAFKFKFQGMVTLASNKPIFMGDDSYGLSRRLIPIPFTYTIPESEQYDLTDEFTTDLPAFTTYLLNLDRDWVTNTLRQAKDLKAIKDLEWALTIETDSIAAFYEEKLIYDPKPSTYDGEKMIYERDWVLAANAYKAYREFCSDTGFSPKHQNNFCSSLVNLLTDKLKKSVSSRKIMTGKVIDGIRLRIIGDPINDGMTAMTAFCEKNEKNENDSVLDRNDGMTTKTEKQFSLEISPKPPTSDRPIPETVKVDDFLEYQLIGDSIQWLEIAFHKRSIAKEWQHQLNGEGFQASIGNQPIRRNGNKWLLTVKGLTHLRLEQLLTAELGQSPRQLTR
jgi:phage/plasmid-associated DNA primase